MPWILYRYFLICPGTPGYVLGTSVAYPISKKRFLDESVCVSNPYPYPKRMEPVSTPSVGVSGNLEYN